MNLTEEEEAMVDFTDDEEDEPLRPEWAVVGKVLSLTPIHVNTMRSGDEAGMG
jgi:hypothetical protein